MEDFFEHHLKQQLMLYSPGILRGWLNIHKILSFDYLTWLSDLMPQGFCLSRTTWLYAFPPSFSTNLHLSFGIDPKSTPPTMQLKGGIMGEAGRAGRVVCHFLLKVKAFWISLHFKYHLLQWVLLIARLALCPFYETQRSHSCLLFSWHIISFITRVAAAFFT